MSFERTKRVVDKFSTLRDFIKHSPFYMRFRDHCFFKEQRKEMKIEKKYGQKGMIEYCKKWYRRSTGETLDFDNPVTFTQKQQWIKFYDQNPIKTTLSDKYLVRSYISEKVGSKYLVPLITVDGNCCFDDAFKIDFDKLPNKFVLSCNHGTGMTIVVNDKSKLSKRKIIKIKKQLNRWLKINIAYLNAFDFIYKDIKPCILILEYLQDESGGLEDYKFMCIDGEPIFFWIDSGRFGKHKRTTYDLNFNETLFSINSYPKIKHSRPKQLEEMIDLARKLSKGLKLLRVDFYICNGHLYLGELTVNPSAGKEQFHPSKYNLIIGEKLKIK